MPAPRPRSLAQWIACGFGSGLFPVAPGTAGSLAALGLGVAMLWLAPPLLLAAAALATAGGFWAVRASGAQHDPGWVVIDEFAGQWIALLPLLAAPLDPLSIGLAFLAFRLLDILKPGPIGWADRQPGAFGVMADDVIAGALAAGIVWGTRQAWPAWFTTGGTG